MSSALSPRDLEVDELLLIPSVVLLEDGPITDYAVVVKDGQIEAVGPADQVASAHPWLTALDLNGHLLMPGLIDTHHHLTQTFGKALAFGEPSEIFRRIWLPLEESLDEHTAYLSAKLGALESLRGGFTTVCDAGTRALVDLEAVAAAVRETGIRCVIGQICNDGDGLDPGPVMTRAAAHLTRWNADPAIHPSLAISIPEAASDATLHNVSRLCADAGAVFQIHLNEHLAAVERSLERRRVRPLEHLHQIDALGPQVLAAHATLLTPEELLLLAETDTAVSYNPIASAWKGNAVAPALTMATQGIRFGIGTDGTRGDGFRLLDAAETAQRLAFGLQVGDSSCGGGWTWLEHATAGGADAAGLGHLTGRIAPGLQADLLLIDLQVPELTPSWDLPWELVRVTARDQIVAVLVAGRLRLWQGWPHDWDGRALIRAAATASNDVLSRADIRRVHPASMAHRTRTKRPLPLSIAST